MGKLGAYLTKGYNFTNLVGGERGLIALMISWLWLQQIGLVMDGP
jgi:hypothetical protein